MNKQSGFFDAASLPASRRWLRLAQMGALAMLAGLHMLFAPAALAQTTVNIAQTPLLALKPAPGLVMLTMSRDHRLFYAAYNDTSDVDGDGVVDVGFKPNILYYGNFVSDRCYDYVSSGASFVFRPVAMAIPISADPLASDGGCKQGASKYWHGNWLNWAATSRIDALRRVLYGGYRQVDSATTAVAPSNSSTVLQAAYIPKDSHVWGKEYRPTRDKYKIDQYTPLNPPSNLLTKQHLFVVVKDGAGNNYGNFLTTAYAPVLRYITDADQTTERIWTWASADVAQGIGSNPANFVKGGGRNSVAATDRVLRVEACAPLGGVREAGCVGYPVGSATPTVWKPTGVLHDYSTSDTLKFGLITGSYQNNYSGGVLRQNVRSFKDEIDPATGRFGLYTSATNTFAPADTTGIARTIDRLAINGWTGSQYDCGYKTDGNRPEGACKSWGAPVAEMMYEGLRYFSGKPLATSAYDHGVSAATSADRVMGFSAPPAWLNPYRAKADGGSPICSRPVQMVIADPLTSFDSDQLPTTQFLPTGGFGNTLGTSDLTGLNVSTEADAIWNAEGLGTRNVYVGQSGALYDGNPTAKSASGFSQIIGHAPDETQSRGGYFSAGVARFGHVTGIPTGAPTGYPTVVPAPSIPQKVDTISLALGSLTPTIEFTTAAGGKVSIVPLSKAVANGGINKAPGAYQATGAITGFYFADFGTTPATPPVGAVSCAVENGNCVVPSGSTAMVYYGKTASFNYKLHVSGTIPCNNATFGDPLVGTAKACLYVLDSVPPAPGAPTSVSAIVNFSDSDQGTDNETDAQVRYDISLNGTTLTVKLTQLDPSPGGIQSNSGYVISGTTNDGLYLDTRSSAGGPQVYYLDTLAGQSPKSISSPLNGSLLPTFNAAMTPVTRTFTTTLTPSSPGGFIPHDTLWYAAKYGGPADGSGVPLLNSKGDPLNYFKVTNPAALPEQMGKAFRSAASLAAVASTSVVGVGQRSLGTAAIYQANYDSLTWSSRLYAFSVKNDGTVSDTTLWEASTKLGAPAARTKLFLGRGGNSAPLALTTGRFNDIGYLTVAEQADFGDATTFEYLLGDKSNEERKGGKLRNRGTTGAAEFGSVLGDIVNSDPQIISYKDYGYGAGDSSYASFLATLTTESLAVGSNDGFFHIFDATPLTSGGGELFGFMPQAARTNVKDLALPTYSHRYFVDGSIGQGHAKMAVPDDASVAWRTIVVAAGGGGAKAVFAVNASSQTYSSQKVLWEVNANISADVAATLGNVMGRPAIGKLANGTWVAIFGNGYNSTTGAASLYVVNLQTGAIIRRLVTDDSTIGNGLGSTEIVKITTGNKDTIEFVYGADYKGNIWRFKLGASDPNTWNAGALIYSTPTTTPNVRRVTAELKVGPAVVGSGVAGFSGINTTLGGKNMVYFGTGTYLNGNDALSQEVQALYGIYDDTTSTSSVTPAVIESALVPLTLAMASATADTRQSSDATPAWYTTPGKKGWVLALTGTNVQLGERVIAPPVRYTVSGNKVDAFLFTSIVPGTDDCVAGVDAWITGIDAMSGGYVKIFDGLGANSIKITGGSPRGVFVLQDGGDPSLYISQTIFNGNITTTSFTTSTGGNQTVTINGTPGQTRVLGIKLTKASGNSAILRQVWRQLK